MCLAALTTYYQWKRNCQPGNVMEPRKNIGFIFLDLREFGFFLPNLETLIKDNDFSMSSHSLSLQFWTLCLTRGDTPKFPLLPCKSTWSLDCYSFGNARWSHVTTIITKRILGFLMGSKQLQTLYCPLACETISFT